MYYSQIRNYDTANGVGIRTTLFVSGCTRSCEGCFNEEYKNFRNGLLWDKETETKFLKHISSPNINGVSILGGEPFDQIRDNSLVNLIQHIKFETNKNIWIYSGYVFEDIIKNPKRKAILKGCDILVDGPFEKTLKDARLSFRGSSNQRIIDIQKSLIQNLIVLYDI
ncbi:anaerobic ribonucleoside-triphosphate reductase activating protein [Candidatus Epulonipiscium viviparus]|uniref:anaerobic ribonucleoside-triphosphate reductase activating protein n=1 Tax=Candidatus Epulonipiscium viviparus TaxID=420336 RepID=UPI0027380750|nr:anaerobic ribonucleoside-triphosphate reductase activating protein [Candidatus Epulopiscium viviparus]